MITLYTPATGFPDLEAKIAYGLARVGVEAFGIEKVSIYRESGFYSVVFDVNESEISKLNQTFNTLCQRILSSSYLPYNTPGIAGRSAENICITENETFKLDLYKAVEILMKNKKTENICRHSFRSVGNIIGLAVSTSFHNQRDGLDVDLQYKNPKDKNSPKIPRRPTNPKRICKVCALLSLIGTWYATFFFYIAKREVLVIPIPNETISGYKLQQVFALQHQIRKNWIKQDFPQILLPLLFLSKIPSSASILREFDLFIAVLSRQQGYHVDGLSLISIENYSKFISYTPYNVATIENILNTFGSNYYTKEAYASFEELNNIISNLNKGSILKFARLYVMETSPKRGDYINLLYPETSKYLLKEVAMISQDIIEHPAIHALARTLRYFVRERNYTYVDNIRNAKKDSRDFEETITKMLREAELRRIQQEQDKNSGREVKNWIYIPNADEIKKIFSLANQDFESTKLALVIFAFTFPAKEEDEK
ncbi:MAG: type I-A CRISPR-associated protein Csa5 [Thermodesulfovibrio sp.]|nr:type I-A CRISPR-associated protein Csa5 [Thermodesulfovibrio sp.]